MRSNAISKAIIQIGNTVQGLTVPPGAVSCIISMDANDQVTNPLKAGRFWETGDDPTTSEGMILSDGGAYEILGRKNMERFKAISTENGITHKLMVTYYD